VRELSLVEGCLVIMCGVTDGQRELVMVRVNDVKGFISRGANRKATRETMEPHKVVSQRPGFNRIACGPCHRGRSAPEL